MKVRNSLLAVLVMPILGSGQEFDSTTMLVKHRRNARVADIDKFHAQQGGANRFKYVGWSVVRMGEESKRKNYENSTLFERVQFARIYDIVAVPNDSLYPEQWGLEKIQAPTAWDKATGNDVVVAVIDTGIDYEHPDLRDNLWTGPQGEHGYTASGGLLTVGGRD